MHVVYVGPVDSVWIRAIGRDAARGVPVEVPDELGASLLEQPRRWRAATPDELAPTATPDPEPESELEPVATPNPTKPARSRAEKE